LIAAADSEGPPPAVRVEYQMENAVENGQWSQEDVAALWREHQGWVAAVLYAHMPRCSGRGPNGGVPDVNDLLQEVAMSLVAHINTLKSPENIAPWLRTVAVNVARDAGRRLKVRRNTQHAGDTLDALPARSGGSERSGAAEDARDRGRRAMELVESLPPDYREPLLLSLRGLTHKQIARVLDLPPSTIETRLFRARGMVRRELAAGDGRGITGA
jgi:RNA polymerase sigma factor (sigma-70 family)